ncbi:MAG: PepSY domain-containing protein [Gammaproteobacteria bacterium]
MVKMTSHFVRLSVAALLFAAAPVRADEKPTEEDHARIQARLAEMECEMDPADIEKDDDGFELENVICTDGQYEIEMNSGYEVVKKHKE